MVTGDSHLVDASRFGMQTLVLLYIYQSWSKTTISGWKFSFNYLPNFSMSPCCTAKG